MKKLMITMCLLYAVDSYAMGKTIAEGLLRTTPITLPGFYYYCQAGTKMREDFSQQQYTGAEVEARLQEADVFRSFTRGAVCGLIPPINIGSLSLRTLLHSMRAIHKKSKDEEGQPQKPLSALKRAKNHNDEAEFIGLGGGFLVFMQVVLKALK